VWLLISLPLKGSCFEKKGPGTAGGQVLFADRARPLDNPNVSSIQNKAREKNHGLTALIRW